MASSKIIGEKQTCRCKCLQNRSFVDKVYKGTTLMRIYQQVLGTSQFKIQMMTLILIVLCIFLPYWGLGGQLIWVCVYASRNHLLSRIYVRNFPIKNCQVKYCITLHYRIKYKLPPNEKKFIKLTILLVTKTNCATDSKVKCSIQ